MNIKYIGDTFFIYRGRNVTKHGKTMTLKDLADIYFRNSLTFGKKAREKLEPLIRILNQK
jgi:hypothetical protein